MKNLTRYITIVLVFAGLFSCDMLDPVDENRLTSEYIGTDPESAEGILIHGYTGLINQYAFSEGGTDDAVNNQLANGYKRMANGELTAQFNPASRWNKYEEILYLNKFIQIIESGTVEWNRDEEINSLYWNVFFNLHRVQKF